MIFFVGELQFGEGFFRYCVILLVHFKSTAKPLPRRIGSGKMPHDAVDLFENSLYEFQGQISNHLPISYTNTIAVKGCYGTLSEFQNYCIMLGIQVHFSREQRFIPTGGDIISDRFKPNVGR